MKCKNQMLRIFWLNILLLAIAGCSSNLKIVSPANGLKNNTLFKVYETNNSQLTFECQDDAIGSSDTIEELSKFLTGHIVEFDEDGKKLSTEFNITCDDKPTNSIISSSLYDDCLVTKKSDCFEGKKIVFIYHGGLVGKLEGIQSTLDSLFAMLNDGIYLEKHYPIFINWRTGGVDAYTEQTLYIRNGVKEPVFGPVTAPYNILSDLGSGISNMFTSATLEGHRLFKSMEKEKFNYCQSNLCSYPKVICPTDQSHKKNYPEGLGGISYVLVTPVRMATAPLLNGLGKTGWENMVRRTRNLIWRENPEENCKPNCLKKGGLVELFDYLQKYPSGKNSPKKISMIGHSMGTILITDIIHHYPKLNYEDIVFMGAAVSIHEFQNTLRTLLVAPQKISSDIHFYNLSLLPIAEAREFSGKGLLPSGSLLELVDEMFTSSPSRLDKTLGKWNNVREVLNTFPEYAEPHMTFKIFGLAQDQPHKHGDFNNTEFRYWRKSFWTDNRCFDKSNIIEGSKAISFE